MIWASKAAFDKMGAAYPTTWEDLNALAPRFIEAGIISLANGGQAWQEACMFEAVASGVGGAEFYRNALIDLDDATPRGPEMVAVIDQLAALRGLVDKNFAGRDWNLASAMVIKGEASVYLVNSLSLFTQTDPDLIAAQEVLASAIMDPGVQIAFNQAKGAIPARTDIDLSAMNACAQETSASLGSNDAGGTALPTFAGTHAANAAVVGAATDAITGFFNSEMTASKGATALADAIAATK